MDPLSIAASILAVVSAAQTAAEVVKKLVALRHVPDQILQLNNEISPLYLDNGVRMLSQHRYLIFGLSWPLPNLRSTRYNNMMMKHPFIISIHC
jgi:hypothetical protein